MDGTEAGVPAVHLASLKVQLTSLTCKVQLCNSVEASWDKLRESDGTPGSLDNGRV